VREHPRAPITPYCFPGLAGLAGWAGWAGWARLGLVAMGLPGPAMGPPGAGDGTAMIQQGWGDRNAGPGRCPCP
jgi:hypothetical protein